jgi:hypothetical protein
MGGNVMYFINEYHEGLFHKFLDKLGYLPTLESKRLDPEYGAFAYLMAAVQKEYAMNCFDEEGIHEQQLKEKIDVWSSGERALARLAMQLFNSRMDNITTYEVFYSLGDDWAKAAIQGMKIRYRLE